MALSEKCKKRVEVALARRDVATELCTAIDTGFNATPAAHIAALGTTTNIPVVNVTLSTTDTYTDAAVKTAIDAGANAVRTAAEARLDAIEAKVDALLAALVTAGLMS